MKMLKLRLALLAVASQIIFASMLYAQDELHWLIPRAMVASTELKIVWQFNLPMGEGESLDQLFLCGNRLCTLSSRNFLSCINRADGNVMFANSIAPAGLPVADFESYKGELLTMVGKKIIEISADFGSQKTATQIDAAVVCPVVRNESFFYIAGADNRIHVLKADNKVNVFEVAADNGSSITSVLAEQEFVVFATEAGNVIRIAPDKSVKVWQFNAPAAIIGPVVHDTNSLYFACRDTCVYRLELSSGDILWKYQTQGILDAAPQLGGKLVYQCVPGMGLAAIDKQTGKLVWQIKDGAGMLSESGNKTFVITKDGHLAAMDSIKAKQLYSIYLGLPVKYATNTADAKIYIADAEGRITCLEPAK
ncbi:MAG: PQQ-binding-like beta-propeller repeat protein [Sedimentisphaerales bacterium]